MGDVLTVPLGIVRRAASLVLDILLPPVCLTCETVVDAPGRLCPACFARTGFITEPCCAACGLPFKQGQAGGPARICTVCHLDPPPWRRARAALRYDAQARRLILPLKYHDRIDLADALAPMMVRAGTALLRDADVIVPVPLHRRRLFSRRYNQSALLARAIGRLSARDVMLDGLTRVRATRPLGELSASARTSMVAGAFAVSARQAPLLAGRRVLLIDDVLTSGATCRACAEALLWAGAVSVDLLVAARVPAPAFAASVVR